MKPPVARRAESANSIVIPRGEREIYRSRSVLTTVTYDTAIELQDPREEGGSGAKAQHHLFTNDQTG